MIVFEVVSPLPAVLSEQDLLRLGKQLAHALRLKPSQTVGIRCVSLAIMKQLNTRYRGRRRPTDVLSFEPALLPAGLAQKGDHSYLGDLVLCPAYAKQEAQRRGLSWREEMIRLIVHGVLHLLGYDHATEQQEARMFALQERCVWSMMRTSV